MPKFAVIDDSGVVVNLILADTKDIADLVTGGTFLCIEVPDDSPVGGGFIYNPVVGFRNPTQNDDPWEESTPA